MVKRSFIILTALACLFFFTYLTKELWFFFSHEHIDLSVQPYSETKISSLKEQASHSIYINFSGYLNDTARVELCYIDALSSDTTCWGSIHLPNGKAEKEVFFDWYHQHCIVKFLSSNKVNGKLTMSYKLNKLNY